MNFKLTILRPDKEFFSGEVTALTVSKSDGKQTILANHLPLFMNLSTAICHFTNPDGTIRTFAMGEGMLSVMKGEVILQSDFLAWEEKMASAIAHREKYIHAEAERRKKSFLEYKLNKIEMAKTFMRLQNNQAGREAE